MTPPPTDGEGDVETDAVDGDAGDALALSPGREEFQSLAERALDAADFTSGSTPDDGDGSASAGESLAVVYASVSLEDVDVTPLGAYAALTGRTATPPGGNDGTDGADGGAHAFLLESAEKVASSDPAGAFRASAAEPDASRHARYSFVGYDPAAVVTIAGGDVDVTVPGSERYERFVDADAIEAAATDGEHGRGDVFDGVRAAMPDATPAGFQSGDRQHLQGGLVGFFGYEAVYDAFLSEHGVDRPASRVPDAQFVLATTTLVFDHVADTVELAFTPVLSPQEDAGVVHDVLAAEARAVRECLANAEDLETGGFRQTGERAGSRAAYEASVERAKEHVLDGDVYQAVLSRTRQLAGDVDALGFYESLRDVNPSPYMYLLGYDGLDVVGASPETLVSVRDGEVVANPIAGTCERGESPVEDRALAGELLADEKERAEHTMLVDLARNDVRRVSEPGSVRVREFMDVLKYSHVQHIESTVTGALAADADAFDATRASFPAGTLSGAPKTRAMEIVDALETDPRGLYGGGVGYYSWTGDADFAIVIRTATVDRATNSSGVGLGVESGDETGEMAGGARDVITVRAGAGIVADSDPASEYDETEQKMQGVLDALDRIAEPSESAGEDSVASEEQAASEVSR